MSIVSELKMQGLVQPRMQMEAVMMPCLNKLEICWGCNRGKWLETIDCCCELKKLRKGLLKG